MTIKNICIVKFPQISHNWNKQAIILINNNKKYFHITIAHVTIKTKVMGSVHDKYYILFNASCFVIVAGYITVKTTNLKYVTLCRHENAFTTHFTLVKHVPFFSLWAGPLLFSHRHIRYASLKWSIVWHDVM